MPNLSKIENRQRDPLSQAPPPLSLHRQTQAIANQHTRSITGRRSERLTRLSIFEPAKHLVTPTYGELDSR